VAGCFISVLTATYLVSLRSQSNLIWVANGMLLAYLLLAPRWRWRLYFAAGFAAQFTGAMLAGAQTAPINLAMSALNLAEVAIAAFYLRKRSTRLPRFTNRIYLLRFLACAVVSAPAVIGVAFSLIAHLWVGLGIWPEFRDWFTTDALGMAVATPAFVAIFRTKFKGTVGEWTNLAYPAALIVLVPLLFQQTRIPAMAVIFPLLVLIQLRLGLGWASLATMLVAGAGSYIASRSGGTIQVSSPIGVETSDLRLQIFVAAAMFTLYSISVVVENLRSTERKLREIVYLHELVTKNSRDVIILADLEGNRSYVSAAAKTIGGWEPDELRKGGSFAFVHPDDVAKAQEAVRKLKEGADHCMIECRARKKTGEYAWVEASLRVVRDPETGAPKGVLNILREITERKHAEESREFQQSLLRAIHEVSLDGILVVNEEGVAVSYNRRFSEVWRLSAPGVPASMLKPTIGVLDQQLLSHCVNTTKYPDAFLTRVQELYSDREANDQCQFELKDGRTLERYTTALRTESGTYLGRVWFFRDITERKHAEQRLEAAYRAVERLAAVDPLTGLANRRRFDECLAAEWRRGLRERRPLSIVLIDVDLFKLYNDTYGHVRGDACLKQIAESAMDVVTRPADLVSRFGGEEFAIILPDTDPAGAVSVANQVCAALQRRKLSHEASPYGLVTISAGCATLLPQPGALATDLIEHADSAMYEAKRTGRNRVCSYRVQELSIADQPMTVFAEPALAAKKEA
jgi:diguanylate cyclase (GGDEF)-like protein/PAS domain S-box-containing protein